MSIASELERIRTAKSAIRSAVNEKGGNLAENQLLNDYAAAITALPEGGNIDLGFITAGADQILERFTGADQNGNPVYGNIKLVTPELEDNVVTVDKGYVDRQFLLTVPEALASITEGNVVTTHAGYHPENEEITVGTEQGATAITPGTNNQTAATAGTYLTGPITVLGDADLIAENIAEGKEIFGVAGTHKGGSSMEFYKCASVDTSTNTWTGYKAVLTDGVYSFEETITPGLTYGTVIPKVKGIYSADALVEVRSMYYGYDPAMVFYAPLSAIDDSAITGQTLVYTGTPQVTEVNGLPCMHFDRGQGIETAELIGISGNAPRTVCFGALPENGTPDYPTAVFFGSDNGDRSKRNMIGARLSNDGKLRLMFGGWNNDTEFSSSILADGRLHHCAMVYTGNELRLYIDGVHGGGSVNGLDTTDSKLRIAFASVASGYAYGGYLSEVRVYNRALSDSEIAELAGEFFAGGNTAPVFYTPLSEAKTTAETGQALTVSGNPVYGTVDGVPCITFDGSSHMSFPDAGLPAGTSARTLSCWFKLNTIEGNSNPALFGYGVRENGKFCGLFIESDGKVVFSGYNEQNHLYSPTGAVSVGKWYHVAAIKNGASEKLYINGVKVVEGTTGKNTELALGTIAYTTETTAHKLNGSLAACRIYERALSETEIVELAGEFTPESGGDDDSDSGYLVTGSGAGDYVNGTYLPDGEKNGLPIYKCNNGAKMECLYTVMGGVQYEERRWEIYDSTGALAYYQNEVKGNMPDSGGWNRASAPDPVPTVTKM